MKKFNPKYVCASFAFFILLAFAGSSAFAQTAGFTPELSVEGFRLADDETASRAVLQNYSPRYDNETNQPKYFFYNEYGNQVLSVTAHSKEHPYLIVAVEVFAVGKSYQKKHYQMKDKSFFTSESGFFLGRRPSATSMLFAAPNMTGPKEIIKKKGTPSADEKLEKTRTLIYQFSSAKNANSSKAEMQNIKLNNAPAPVFGSYRAEYHFVKNELRRFVIKIDNVTPPPSPVF